MVFQAASLKAGSVLGMANLIEDAPMANNPVPPTVAAAASLSLGAAAQSCCKSSGFERPSYFAGHLLTDADLTLEQRYFREKRKLQNRTLHGQGIVCGLRLTCDHHNARRVIVSRGYALDDRGNDLVVPESASFDVVGLLIEKGLIYLDPPLGPSGPQQAVAENQLRKRFYLTVSYQEEKVDFVAPLVSGGPPVLSEREPTRVREMVCLDVSDVRPAKRDASEAIKRRLGTCFRLFSEGAFAHALRSHRRVLSELVTSEGKTEHNYEKIFHELQGYLLLYFRNHPDKYDPALPDKIRNVHLPFIQKSGQRVPTDDVETLQATFSSLLALAWQHAVDDAFGEILPACPDSSETPSVLLGSVTIENGRVVRVSNCSRSYVWAPANFPNVLMATTLGGVACRDEDEREADGDQTPADFDFECFLRWLSVSPKAPYYAGTELLRFIETVRKSIQDGFDFTNPCNFSTRMFEEVNGAEAENHLRGAGVPYRVKAAPLDRVTPPLFAVLQAAGLASGNEPIVLEVSEGSVSSAGLRHSDLVARIQHLQIQIDGLKAQMQQRG
jgi:hypothetical protein